MADLFLPPAALSRKEARDRGLKLYFTGKPCSKGHVANRHVYQGSCVECAKVSAAAHRKKNAARIRDFMIAWRARHPDRLELYASKNRKPLRSRMPREERLAKARDREKRRRERERDHLNAKTAAWRADLRKDPTRFEESKAYHRNYYRENEGRLKAYHQRYARENVDKMRKWGQDRRARRANARGNGITVADVKAMHHQQKGRCAYCKCSGRRLTIDHMIAISVGGPHCLSNAVLACRSCNSGKRDHPLAVFLARLRDRVSDCATEAEICALISRRPSP